MKSVESIEMGVYTQGGGVKMSKNRVEFKMGQNGSKW
jgi:hypothetical protein